MVVGCVGKNAYDKRTAETVRNKRLKKGEKYLRIYQCKNDHYHITHQKSFEERGKLKLLRPNGKPFKKHTDIYENEKEEDEDMPYLQD